MHTSGTVLEQAVHLVIFHQDFTQGSSQTNLGWIQETELWQCMKFTGVSATVYHMILDEATAEHDQVCGVICCWQESTYKNLLQWTTEDKAKLVLDI